MPPVTRNPDASVRILNWGDMPPPVGGATEATQQAILAELLNKLEAGGTVALDAATLAALENVVVSGAVTVSGTVTANLGTIDGAATEATLASLALDVANGVAITQPVAVTDNGGSLTVDGSVTVSGTVSVTEPVSVDDNGGSLTVDGTVGISGSVAVTGPLTDTQLRATPVPVSGTVTANLGTIGGAATEVTLASLAADVANGVTINQPVAVTDNSGSLTVDTPQLPAALVSGRLSVDASAVAVPVTDNGGSLTVDGTVAVSGSVAVTGPLTDTQLRATPVPVSGTVAVTQPVAVTDNSGSLTVDGTVDLGATTLAALESITVQNPAGASAVNIQDGGNSITVDGTVAISGTIPVSGTVDTELTTQDYDSGAGTVTTAVVGVVVPASGGPVAILGDAANGLDVDVTRVSGTVTVTGPLTDTQLRATPVPISGTVTANAGTGPWPVTDNGGSLTVDTPQLPAALVSGRLSVDASAVAVPVTDNGGSLTVDGTVAVSGSVAVTGPLTDTQLRASAVPVSGTFFQATQPISGTVTANLGTIDGAATETTLASVLTRLTAPTTVRNGQATVAVTNTAVAISASVAVTGLVVQALAANAGNVVVGSSTVTVANGFQLQPGQATGIAIDDASKVFVNGTSGDGVCFVGS